MGGAVEFFRGKRFYPPKKWHLYPLVNVYIAKANWKITIFSG